MRKKIKNIRTQILTYVSVYISPICVICVLFLSTGCQKNYSPEQKEYIVGIEKERQDKNEYMKDNPNSPFNYKRKMEFHDLNYFDVDPAFVFKSKLYEYNPKDTITIYGTKGEPRKVVKYGYVKIKFPKHEEPVNINVYEGKAVNGETYYSIWFTDKTTNEESYGVGRYIDFEKSDNPDYVYTIDFNLAYNPYCAYSPEYSCAIPTKEDYIPVEIRAGEKKFHE